MTPTGQSGNPADSLPLLTEVVGEDVAGDFPILTEEVVAVAVPKPGGDGSVPEADAAAGMDEAQKILQQMEAYLETEFAEKLALRIEELQRQAVKQAVDELKAELPELLRNAIAARD